MKKKSKWGTNPHGAYCECEKCAKQYFNIHRDLETDNDLSDLNREYSGKRGDSDESSGYLDAIDRIFGE